MKSNPRPKREEHPHPEKDRTESTGSGLERQTVDTRAGEAHSSCTGVQKGQGVGDSLGGPKEGGVIMALKDEQG